MTDLNKLTEFISAEFSAAASLLNAMSVDSPGAIAVAAQALIDCYQAGGKVLVFGNGGSAADAQHMAAELACRYRVERSALPAIALTTDSSILTAVGNDIGFSSIFSRQVEALAVPGDVVIGISTSGRSGNVIAGIQTALVNGAHTIALIGADITGLGGLAETVISVPSLDTPRIQEAHAVIIHIICDLVERAISKPGEG